MTVSPLLWAIGLLLAYLAGAIPFGLLLGLARGVDIRKHGSGNVGATNCGRVLGRKWGIACFVLDLAKGLLPVLGFGMVSGVMFAAGSGPQAAAGPGDSAAAAAEGLAGLDPLLWDTLAWLAVGVAAVAGHMFPLWLRFKGGKGVATGLGVVLGFWPVLTAAGLLGALLWLAMVRWKGYVSLASMIAASALPLLAVVAGRLWGKPPEQVAPLAAVCLLLAGLVVLRHRSNITRLRAGSEDKVRWLGRK